jgi:hypothetical protein
MAKKRTLLPFYGKASQAWDQAAHKLFKAGDREGATMAGLNAREIRAKRKAQAS